MHSYIVINQLSSSRKEENESLFTEALSSTLLNASVYCSLRAIVSNISLENVSAVTPVPQEPLFGTVYPTFAAPPELAPDAARLGIEGLDVLPAVTCGCMRITSLPPDSSICSPLIRTE